MECAVKRVFAAVFISLLFAVCDFYAVVDRPHADKIWALPTLTPSPRLPQTAAHERIKALFETNGSCRFPCWWGIVPGQTRWQDAHALLSPLLEGYTESWISDDFVTDGYYSDSPGEFSIYEPANDTPQVGNLLIEGVRTEYLSKLKLSSILQAYGRPEEIYIRSPRYEFNNFSCLGEFELFLYYPAQQFAVRYRYPSYPVDQPVEVCDLDQPALSEFYLWEPSHHPSFEQASDEAGWFAGPATTRAIEDATEWSIEAFYTAFESQRGSAACFHAPAFDWSNPRLQPIVNHPSEPCATSTPTP
jgi:hypothetical protein